MSGVWTGSFTRHPSAKVMVSNVADRNNDSANYQMSVSAMNASRGHVNKRTRPVHQFQRVILHFHCIFNRLSHLTDTVESAKLPATSI